MALSKIWLGVLAGVLVLLTPATVAAQGPRPMNVAVGFAAVSDPNTDNLTPGWSVSGAVRLHRLDRFLRMTSVVVDAGGSYGDTGDNANVRVHAAMAGLRLARERDAARFWPFAQLLVGGECYCGTTATLGNLFRGFAYQPGAGLDWPLSRSLALRIQGDVRRTLGESGGVTRFRIATGAVLRLGPSGSDAMKNR